MPYPKVIRLLPGHLKKREESGHKGRQEPIGSCEGEKDESQRSPWRMCDLKNPQLSSGILTKLTVVGSAA